MNYSYTCPSCSANVSTDNGPSIAIEELIPFLRTNGVARFKSNDLEIHLFPQGPAVDTSPLIPKALTMGGIEEPEKCACGHDDPAHGGDGLCLLGCPAHICAKSSKP